MKPTPVATWDTLSLLDQWIWLMRSEIRERDIRSSSVTKPREDLSRVTKKLLEDQRERLEDDCVLEHVPGGLSSSGLFRSFYKEIFRELPFGQWAGLLEDLNAVDLPFTRREVAGLRRLSSLWADLESQNRRIRLESLPIFIESLTQSLGWRIEEIVGLANESIHLIEVRGLSVALPPILPLVVTFVQKKKGGASRTARWTEGVRHRLATLDGVGGEVAINIAVGQGAEYRKYIEYVSGDRGIILLGERALKQIFSADHYAHELQKVIKASLGLQRLNPYRAEGAVDRPAMFYGRKEEVATILNSARQNFMIVGSRRIGKSSLLARLQQVTLSSGSRRPIFLDCSEIRSAQMFAEQVAIKINPKRLHRIRIGHIAQMVRASQSTQRAPFLFLLDEADPIVDMAREQSDWSILNVLRGLSNTGTIQCVITGYKALYEAWQDLSTPLYNFVSPMYLSVLAEESARKLVTEPLRSLGVRFTDDELIRQIVEESGCHPSFLQFFGSELIHRLDQTSSRRVTAREINYVRETQAYREFVLKPFRYETNLDQLERWLVLSLTHAKQHVFGSRLVLDAFGSREGWLRVEDIARALRGLELAGLIRGRSSQSEPGSSESDHGLQYRWTIPAFPLTLDSDLDIETHIKQLTNDLREP